MNLYEILQNPDRVGEGMTHFERLFAQKVGGGKINEISGVPPLRYIGDGRPLTDYLISGNALQDGTPTPDAPVEVQGCGVRTGNLARYWKAAYVNSSGSISANRVNGVSYPVKIESGQTVTFSNQKTNFGRGFAVFRGFDGTDLSDMVYRTTNNSVVYAADEDCYVIIWGNLDNTTSMDAEVFSLGAQMLNLGDTALPYEPYGYKLPLTVNGTEYPIYLGQVETTRRIKKLVLTGEEPWYTAVSSSGLFGIQRFEPMQAHPFIPSYSAISNFYVYNPVQSGVDAATASGEFAMQAFRVGSAWQYNFFIKDNRYGNVTDFKSYLAAQYAAGTPVTVWYVLAEPETAVVNEPLMKIGDYADTVSAAQAGVTIPTVRGENVLDVPTEVKPSEVWIQGKIKEV